MPKRRLKRELDTDNLSVTFTDLDNNESLRVVANDVWPGINDATANVGNNETFRHAICKMVNDTFGDTASDPGKSIPAIKARVEAVTAGQWSMRGEGKGGPRISLLAEALFNIMSRHGAKMPDGSEPTLAAVGEHLAECGDEQRKAYKSRRDVDLEISEIRKARDEAKLKEKRKAVKGQEFEPLTLG